MRKPVNIPGLVVSVGGITAGGSAKTSISAYLAGKFIEQGKEAVVVARGYGRKNHSDLVVSAVYDVSWEDCGDEPLVIAKSVDGLEVYVSDNKTVAAQKAGADGYKLIIIDDGFQHRKLHRNIDILCLDGSCPFGNGMLLPAGRLREPMSAIKRADIVVIIDPTNIEIKRNIPVGIPVFEATKMTKMVKSISGKKLDPSLKRCVAFCGIGNPDSFRRSLNAAGFEIKDFLRFRDHHHYSKEDLDRIVEDFERSGAELIITTLKDAVKLEKIWNYPRPLYYLDIGIKIEKEDEFLAAVGI